jgi:hypothetical protein
MKIEARTNISEVVGNSTFGAFQLGLCILSGGEGRNGYYQREMRL